MKVYKSPYLVFLNHFKTLFIGNTGQFYSIKKISLSIIIRLNLIFLLTNKIKEELLSEGIVFKEHPREYLIRSKAKSIKELNKQTPYIVIAPTMNCNLGCPYCFVKNSLKDISMSKEIIDKIISYIFINGKHYSLDWFGGEPSLNTKIIKYFYEEAEKKGLYNDNSLFITNGTFKNNELWDIIEHNITKIQFTIDGLRQYHDNRRFFKNKKGTFDVIINNLDILYNKILAGKIKHDIDVIIRCNVDKLNQNTIKELCHFVQERYNFLFRLELPKVSECGIKEYNSRLFTDKEYSNFLINLFYKEGIIIEPYLQSYNVRFSHCGAVNSKSYAFDPQGNIYKCCLDIGKEDRIIGNCLKKIFPDNNVEAKYLFSGLELLPKSCEKCFLLFYCWGGCAQERLFVNMNKSCCFHKSEGKNLLYIMWLLQLNREKYPLNTVW